MYPLKVLYNSKYSSYRAKLQLFHERYGKKTSKFAFFNVTKDSGGLHKAQAQDELPGRFGIGNEGYEHIHSAGSRVKVRADQPFPGEAYTLCAQLGGYTVTRGVL